ncbi:unnamed protein product [Pieris macdunnoughi]|uniref:Uncharacterized protein n=1 Tax=Pieris macdunnoughi TaxID=345717 RepID=A0A821XNT1_9NEOP|nr:unnamed protein product [Pieris macdunnoughi]
MNCGTPGTPPAPADVEIPEDIRRHHASAPAPVAPTTPNPRDTALEAMLQILMAMQSNQDPAPLFSKAAECLNRGVHYNDGA